MRDYSWRYGVFHWVMHYILVILLVNYSGIMILPNYYPNNLFGVYIKNNILDYVIVIVLTSMIDIDHIEVLLKFGFKKYIWTEKRLVSPLHNFFSLSFLGILSAFLAIFISRVLAVLVFAIIIHLLWDIFEDVFIFRTSFRKWEKTWGLNKKDIEEAYNQLLQNETQKKKE